MRAGETNQRKEMMKCKVTKDTRGETQNLLFSPFFPHNITFLVSVSLFQIFVEAIS